MPSGKSIFLAVCSLTVSVPVLSEAITVQLPRLSTEFNLLTMTFFLLILLDAIVRAIVNANGRPSGIADTDKAITDKNISVPGTFFKYNKIVNKMAIIITIIVICFENFSILIVNGDLVSLVSATLLAIWPTSVLAPVSTAIAVILPVKTLVPA